MTKTTATVQLEGLVVQLDCLRAAYESIFLDAKNQLESLDITDSHIASITNKLAEHNNLTTKIQQRALSELVTKLSDLSDADVEAERTLKPLLNVLTKRIYTELQSTFKQQIIDEVKNIIDAEFVSNHVLDVIEIQKEIRQSFEKRAILDSIMSAYMPINNEETTEETNKAD